MARAKTVVIIGAGPVGLAAASHALERGLAPIVLEAGAAAGHAIRQWAHVRMFSPWEYNIDAAAQRLLAATGWNVSALQGYPTGEELLRDYIEPLATRTLLKEHIRSSARVTAISRIGFDKMKTKGRERALFEVHYQYGDGIKSLEADAVIDASGTWFSPNPAGASGLPAIGERSRTKYVAYGMPDGLGSERSRYAGKRIAVLGSGHSAIGTLLDLVHLKDEVPGTEVVWLLRGDKPEKAFGGGANDQLAARGELGAAFARLVRAGRLQFEPAFHVFRLSEEDGGLRIDSRPEGSQHHVVVDELIVATGFRPDLSFLGELRLSLDPGLECPTALAPLIDPNVHSCGTVRPHGARELAHPEPGFYIAGMKSYGRAPTFLMVTGYEQVRSIIADIAGDRQAADRVQLVLPETGVCTRSPVSDVIGCCGGAPKTDASACCLADEIVKTAGTDGCGCSSQPQTKKATSCCA